MSFRKEKTIDIHEELITIKAHMKKAVMNCNRVAEYSSQHSVPSPNAGHDVGDSVNDFSTIQGDVHHISDAHFFIHN